MEFKELTPVPALGKVDVEIPALQASPIMSLPGPVVFSLSHEWKHFPQSGFDSIHTIKDRAPMLGAVRRIFAIHNHLERVAYLMIQLGDAAEIILDMVMAILCRPQYDQGKEGRETTQNYGVDEYRSLRMRSAYSEMNYMLEDKSGQTKQDGNSQDSQRRAHDRQQDFLESRAHTGL